MLDVAWLALLRDFGVPVAMLAAIGVGLWRIAAFIAPRFDKMVERHVGFIDAVQKTDAEHGVALVALTVELRSLAGDMKRLTIAQEAATKQHGQLIEAMARFGCAAANGAVKHTLPLVEDKP